MDEIDSIEDNECWALTQMINEAEAHVIAIDKYTGMLEAYETASYKGENESNGI